MLLVPMELKYCERCGGLWLHESEHEEIYCPGCCPEMVDMPRSKKKRVVAVNSIDEVEGCLGELAAFCGEGGNACAPVGFLSVSIEHPEWFEERDSGPNPDLWLYRRNTEAILRRLFRMSLEVGRLPSILGNEFFRTKVTSYRVACFE